jgi:hypothetical protein
LAKYICYKDADYCNECKHKKCDIADSCPLGGDIANDCAGCAESADFHYDPKTGECVRRVQSDDEEKHDVNRDLIEQKCKIENQENPHLSICSCCGRTHARYKWNDKTFCNVCIEFQDVQ